jgi:hypothetical protein
MIREKINNLNKLRFCCYFILLFIIIHVFVVVVLPNGALYSLDFSSAFASVIIAYFLSWVFKRKELKYYDPIVLYIFSALCTILYRSFFYYDQFGNIKLIAVSWAMLSAYFLISGFKNDK